MRPVAAAFAVFFASIAQTSAKPETIVIQPTPVSEEVVVDEAFEEAVEKVVDEAVAQQIANIQEFNVYEGAVNIYEFGGDEAQPSFVVVHGDADEKLIESFVPGFSVSFIANAAATATSGKASKSPSASAKASKSPSSSAKASKSPSASKSGKSTPIPYTSPIQPYAPVALPVAAPSNDVETLDADTEARGEGVLSFLSNSSTSGFAGATTVLLVSLVAGAFMC